MNWRNAWLITVREVRDQLRDRRTLFMVLVLPLVLYPALTIGMLQMQLLFDEQPRTVVVLGTENLPESNELQLVDGSRFVEGWFELPEHVKKLHVVTDLPDNADAVVDDRTPEQRARLLAASRTIRELVEKRDTVEEQLHALVPGPGSADGQEDAEPAEDEASEETAVELEAELAKINAELTRRFADLDVQVLIVIPDGFAEEVGALVRTGAEVPKDEEAGAEDQDDAIDEATGVARRLEPRTVRNVADKKSHVAYSRVKEALDKWKQHIAFARLEKADLPKSLVNPFQLRETDVSSSEERAARLWGTLFPAILVIMCVTGAFHPAVDVAAGEKERGTMETLLICPASRTEIVVGKFAAVCLFSLTTAMLNLVSMGVTAAYMTSARGAAAGISQIGELTPPGPVAIAWVVVLSLPLAALFSALCLSLATFARSSKEGQYYLTPLLMVTLGLTMFCMSPIAEIDPMTSVLPVVGPALLLKETLSTNGSLSVLVYAIPVLVTSIGYSALALWWAIDQFKREDVLFREAERFDLGLWLRHLMRDKEPVPSFAEAGFCFVLVMLLYFAAFRPFQSFVGPSGEPGFALRNMQALMIQQLVVIATPAMLMAIMLTSNPLRTLRFRWPKWQYLVVSLVLAVCLRPIALETMSWLGEWFFKPLPERIQVQMQAMSSGNVPLWVVLLAIAVLPGICEEIAFRGFILSGFDQSQRTWLAIVLSSVAFGIIHLVPQQVFHACVVGLVIGAIAIRSRSLVPCILFHVVSNGLTVLYAQAVGRSIDARWLDPFVVYGEVVGPDGVAQRTAEFTWLTLLGCAAISAPLLYWLVTRRFHDMGEPTTAVDPPPAAPDPTVAEGSIERQPASIG